MIRVIHTGDLHLDSPFRGLSPEKARQRREEEQQGGCWGGCPPCAPRREADVVLIAGDLFDGDRVYYETTRLLADVFRRNEGKDFHCPGQSRPLFRLFSLCLSVLARQCPCVPLRVL